MRNARESFMEAVVCANVAKQFLLDSTVIARSVATKQSHAGRDKIDTLFQGSAHDNRFLDSRLRGNDKWGRGNDNHVSIGTRLPREHSLPRNDGARYNKNVIASVAKQSHTTYDVTPTNENGMKTC